ncbi:MAG: hypothetical protein ACLRFH_00975 [Opitutales bacterium]
MKVKNIILYSSLFVSSLLNGMPEKLQKEAENAENSMSILLGKFSKTDLGNLKKCLEETKNKLMKYSQKDTSGDAWDHIAILKIDLLFLEECSDILLEKSTLTQDEKMKKMKKWCNKSYRYEIYLGPILRKQQ